MTDGVLFAPALVTRRATAGPHRGNDLAAEVVRDAALAWHGGTIVYAGPAAELPELVRRQIAVEPRRLEGAVVPGLVDCHTHLPFYGWRADEFEARLAGRTYRDLHGEGGIYRSSRLLADATDDQVLEFSGRLADEMLRHGTTALELKTGYGLSVEAELRQARLARRLGERISQTTTVTLLACHAVPRATDRSVWVDEVCRQLIPQAARDALADAVDVYVEDIAFTTDDLRRVANVAGEHGLELRCHADQLGPSRAAEIAVELGARTADHLNHVSAEGIAALGSGETTAVLLPASTLILGAKPPPVADLLVAGAPIALATDFNPGTSPCLSIPEVIAVAASLYRLEPRVALTAVTSNAAHVLGFADRLGSLEPGMRADFVVLDSDDVAMVPYRPGHNPVAEVWIEGARVA